MLVLPDGPTVISSLKAKTGRAGGDLQDGSSALLVFLSLTDRLSERPLVA